MADRRGAHVADAVSTVMAPGPVTGRPAAASGDGRVGVLLALARHVLGPRRRRPSSAARSGRTDRGTSRRGGGHGVAAAGAAGAARGRRAGRRGRGRGLAARATALGVGVVLGLGGRVRRRRRAAAAPAGAQDSRPPPRPRRPSAPAPRPSRPARLTGTTTAVADLGGFDFGDGHAARRRSCRSDAVALRGRR